MIAPARPADPLDRVDVVVDQDGEPLDVDRFLDALDRIVERRLSQRATTGGHDHE
jgi:predicted GTPase